MHTRESLIRDVVRFGKSRKGKLTQAGFYSFVGYSPSVVVRRFPGGFADLLRAAGMSGRQRYRLELTNSQVLAEVDRVAGELGREPKWDELRDRARYSMNVFHSRFRGLAGILAAYRDWVAKGRPSVGAPVRAGAASLSSINSYGVPLGFRGVQYAPVTELGVVHLFGVLGAEMGYSVLRIRPGYPDCEAVRRSRVDPDRWERLHIEFELKSSNFAGHRHDPSKCDVIVCWEHDWPGCPIEVVELKSELAKRGALDGEHGALWERDLRKREVHAAERPVNPGRRAVNLLAAPSTVGDDRGCGRTTKEGGPCGPA